MLKYRLPFYFVEKKTNLSIWNCAHYWGKYFLSNKWPAFRTG